MRFGQQLNAHAIGRIGRAAQMRAHGRLSPGVVVRSLVLGALLAATVAPAAHAAPAGEAYGAGFNEYGQLGNGQTANTYAFAPLSGPAEVVQVSPGHNASIALLSNGTVETSGYNLHGELGDGSTTERDVPELIPGLTGATAVSEGSSQSFAVLSGGTVDGWGFNEHGELGDGETNSGGCACVASPKAVESVAGEGALSGVVAISSGFYDTIALLSTGKVVAWGYNYYGELGDGSTTESPRPVPVQGVGGGGELSGVVAISAGAYHNMALLSNGTVVTWGLNEHGELGDEATSQSDVPVAVKGVGGVGVLSGVAAISAGNFFSVALLSSGAVDAWGYNYRYELGNGTTAEAKTPIAVPGVSGVAAIGASAESALAALSAGTLEGWGYNEHGELGTDSNDEVKVPQATGVLLPGGVYAVEHGDDADDSFVLQGATLTASNSNIAFADQALGTQSAPATATVTNDGPGPVVISGEVFNGSHEFGATADTCKGATLAAGATCTITATFSPTAAGVASASVTLASTATTTPLTITFAATGVASASAPALGKLTLSAHAFRAAGSGPSILAALSAGTLVSYTDSEAAKTKFTVQKNTLGVIKGVGASAHCVAAPKRHRHSKAATYCVFHKTVGSFSHADKAGANSFRFSGRIDGRKLRRGKYQLVAVAALSGKHSAARTAKFKVVKR